MGKLPQMSGKNIAKRFERFGYTVVRQRGSHMRLLHHGNPPRKPLTVPDHREIGKGLFRKLLRDAEVSLEEFLKK